MQYPDFANKGLHKQLLQSAIVTLALSLLLPSCTTYRDDGRLVRHHLGYTRVITPQSFGQGDGIQVLEVSNFGLWIKEDHRANDINEGGGFGLGALYTRRESIPLSCSFIIRVSVDQDIKSIIDILNISFGGMNPCIVQDSNLPLSSRG